MPVQTVSEVGAIFSGARSALRRVPAWLVVVGFYVCLAALYGVLRLATRDHDTARVASGFTMLAVFIVVLIVRGKDGWLIYGTLLLVGAALGLLSISVEWKAVAQGVIATGLIYLFADRGWLRDEPEETTPAAAAEG